MYGGEGRRVLHRPLYFADLLQRGVPGPKPASYVTPAFSAPSSLWHVLLGEAYNFFVPSVFPVKEALMLWVCLGGLFSISPARGIGKRLPVATVRCAPRSVHDRRTACFDYQIKGFTLDLAFKSRRD